MMRPVVISPLLLLLFGCNDQPEPLLGTIEWDRVAVLAEASEPVIELSVREGEAVTSGQPLLRLDPTRIQARLEAAQADLAGQRARLAELERGPRRETIDAARAELAQARSERTLARQDLRRTQTLFERGSVARANLDDARARVNSLGAQVDARQARLDELLAGTRPEQLDQARATLQAAQASVAELRRQRQRLDVVAPIAGRVDALPHRLGDQPAQGAVLVSLLGGDTPYARVYIPEPRRAAIRPGDRFRVAVDGIDKPFDAEVRSIRQDPAFTPYYALSGDDAARLSYMAELTLLGEAARELPAGVPCQVWPEQDDEH
ncbi:secretion protein HlyD family protein [Alcanivorax balearicus MACL04]|uniref:Secretion protein HlyD family protein n=1 Tax=Alloalcanivorax balearicus MACL04 TaxID=1177182 RepID=A0ABT2R2C0_9GAMM|nr:HlyD family efflux transporter periplasmic adaptor subunit [Alloalcanivorax balearicus]MCU5783914.1 secretion protein HlyD family protein [Alloalcanivorax balearicus MACL04]